MMLNLLDLKSRLVQEHGIDCDTASSFAGLIEMLIQNLLLEKGNLGTSDIIDALSLLISLKDFFSNVSDWEKLVYSCLSRIRDNIYNKQYIQLAAHGGLTHVAYVVRELSSIIPDLNPFLSNLDTLLLHSVHTYLKPFESNNFHSRGTYELIAGVSGILKYYLDYSENHRFQTILQDLVETLIIRSQPKQICGYTLPGWHYYPSEYELKYIKQSAPNGCVNYGVSHGMGGPLVVLAQAYAKNINTKGLWSPVSDLISEYMKAFYRVENCVCWPGRISLEEYVGLQQIPQIKSRNSWCYGSAGILRALYIAATVLSDTQVQTFALTELKMIAQTEKSNYMLTSLMVCHGLAGIALIFQKMYLDSKEIVFRRKASELCNKIVCDSVKRYDAEMTKYNYLEGYSGIVQTVLSIVMEKSDVNEKRLLIL